MRRHFLVQRDRARRGDAEKAQHGQEGEPAHAEREALVADGGGPAPCSPRPVKTPSTWPCAKSMPDGNFPSACPWSFVQALDDTFPTSVKD